MARYTKDAEQLAKRVKDYAQEIGRAVTVALESSRGVGNHRWVVRDDAGLIVVTWSAHSSHNLWRARAEGDLRKAGLLPPNKQRKKEEAVPTPTAEEVRRSDELRARLKPLIESFTTRSEFITAALKLRAESDIEPFGGYGASSPEERIVDIQLNKFLGGGSVLTRNLDKWERLLEMGLGQNGHGPAETPAEPEPEETPDGEREPEALGTDEETTSRVEDQAETEQLLHEAERMLATAEAERDRETARADALDEEIARLRESEAQARAAWQAEREQHERVVSQMREALANSVPREFAAETAKTMLPAEAMLSTVTIPFELDTTDELTLEVRRRYADTLLRLVDNAGPEAEIEPEWLVRLDKLSGINLED